MKLSTYGILTLLFLFPALSGWGQEAPSLKLGQGDQVKCAGESVTFDLVFTGFGDITYNLAWKKVGNDGSLSEDSELALTNLTAANSGKYYCELRDIAGMQTYYSDTVALTVNEYLAGLPREVTAVIGEQAVVTAALMEGVAYSWTATSVHSVQNNKIIFSAVVPPDREEVVALTATYKGCRFSYNTTLRVAHAVKEVETVVSGDRKGCVGGTLSYSVAVSGSDTYAYSWRKVGDDAELSTTSEYRILSAAQSHSGNYYCVVSDPLHDLTYYSDTVETAVHAYPGVSLTASSLTPCHGVDVVLSAACALADAEVVYRWEKNGRPLTGSAASRTEKADETTAITYKVHADNQGCEEMAQVVVTPTFLATGLPETTEAVIGERPELTATLAEGAIYDWLAASPYTKQNNKITFATILPPEREEVVSLTVAYKGCSFSHNTTLRVVHAEKAVKPVAAGDKRCCEGGVLSYSVTAGGGGNYTYSWRKVGVSTELSTTAAYRIDPAALSHSGKYYCVVSDPLYDLTYYSDTIESTVYAYPGARLVASSPTPCYRGNVELSAGYAITASGLTYRWEKNSQPLAGAMASRTEKVGETVATIYKVYVGNQGCEDSAKVVLTPIVPLTGLARHVPVSIGEPVTVSALPQAGATYAWKMKDEYTANEQGNTVSFVASVKSDTVYLKTTYQGCSLNDTSLLVKSHADIKVRVKAYGYTRVCEGDSLSYRVSVSEESQYNYTWHKLGGGVVGNGKNYVIRSVTAGQAGRYYCKVYDELFDLTFYSDTLEMSVSAFPALSVSANGKSPVGKRWFFCRDTDVSLTMTNTAGQPGVKYLWTGQGIVGAPGDKTVKVVANDSAVYRALITNNGCVKEDSFLLVASRPDVRMPEKVYRIAGEPATLLADGGKGSYAYQWTPVGGASSSSSSYTFTVPAGTTRVVVDVEDVNGCTSSDTCVVEGMPSMVYSASLNDGYAVSRDRIALVQSDTVLCARTPLTLEVNYSGYDGYVYEWMKVNNPTPLATGRTFQIASVADADKGKYYCRAMNLEKNGYVYSDTVEVKVNYRPKAEIVSPAAGEQMCGGIEVAFSGKDAGLPSTTNRYAWSGSGIKSGGNTTSPTVRIGTNGYYRFSITYGQCSDTAEVLIAPIIRKVDIPSDLILSQPSDNVSFVASTNSGGGLFSWSVNGVEQVTASTSAKAFLNVTSGGNVVVKMSEGGCAYYDTCRVLMRPFAPAGEALDDGFAVSCPVLRVTDKELNVCEDGDVSLSVVYLGYERYQYEWRKVGEPFTNILSDSIAYAIRHASLSAAGKYYCRAFSPDINEYIYSDTLTLNVNRGPVARIVSPADGSRVCYGSELTLSSNTDYAPGGSSTSPDVADRLLWSGGGIIGGQGTRELRVRIGDEGTYTLKAIKEGGCSSEVSIHLNVVKPEIDIPPVFYQNQGAEITLSAQRDLMNLEVEWLLDGALVVKSKDEVTLSIQQDAVVVAKLRTAEGCLAEDTCRVFVKGPTTFEGGDNDGFILSRPRPLIPSMRKYMNVCPDSLVTLRVDHAEYPYRSYEWHKSGVPGIVGTGREYQFQARSEHSGFYYCTVVDGDLPGDAPYIYSDTMKLTVYDGPVASLTASVNGNIVAGGDVCPGSQVMLDASLSASGAGAGMVYQWFRDGQPVEGEVSSRLNVTIQDPVTYMVRAGNGECGDTAMIRFDRVRPGIELPGRLFLSEPAAGYEFEVTVPDGAVVAWSFKPEGGGEIAASGRALNLTGDGWVFARVTQDGCTGLDSCRVFVKEGVTFQGGDNDGFHMSESSTLVWIEPRIEVREVCRNNQLKMTANVRGLGKYVFMWHKIAGGVTYPLEQETDTVLIIEKMDETKAGRFFCRVTDVRDMGNGQISYYTDTITVNLKNGPVARIAFADGNAVPSACFGDEFELVGSNVNSSVGDRQLSYWWSGDSYDKLGDDQHIMARPQTSGNYVLEVRDAGTGCSDTATLGFQMHAPQVKIPQSLFMYEPGNLEVLAELEGAGALKWYIDYRSQVKSEANPAVLDITQDAFVIVEFLQDGCSGFDTTKVFVKRPSTYAGGADDGFVMSTQALRATVKPQYVTVCRGADIEVGLSVNDEGRTLKYQWMKVGSASPVSYEKNFVKRANSLADGGRYYCLVSVPAEEVVAKRTISSDTATVTVVNGPVAQIGVPVDGQKVCYGSTVVLDASPTEQNKVSANDEYQYEWFGPDITYTGKQHVVNAVVREQSQYVVKASMGNCATYDTVRLNIFNAEVSIPPVVFLSDEGEVRLGVANPEGNVVKWRFYFEFDLTKPYGDPITADSATFLVTEDARIIVERQANQCSGYDTCRIFVKDSRGYLGKDEDGFVSAGTSFYIKNPEFSNNVCVGEVATIFVKVVGNDFYNYEWRKSGSDKVYSTSSLCRIDKVSKSDEGYYYCVITDVNNNYTQTSNRIYLTVKEKPVAKIKELNTYVCYGNELTLEADRSLLKEGVVYSYLWKGDGVQKNTSYVTPVRPEASGEYVLAVGDGDCVTLDTVGVTVERARLELPLMYHVKSGEDLTLKATVNGKVVPLDWKVNGNPYRGVSSVALANLTKSADFTVKTTGSCGLEQAGHIYVRDNAVYNGGYDDGFTMPNNLPQVLDQCDMLLGCDVDTAVLWISALWMDNLSFEWQKYDETSKRFEKCQAVGGRNNVSGFETDSLRFTAIFADDEGRYRCALSTPDGTTYSREIRLVKGGKPIVKVRMKDGAVCENHEFQKGVIVEIPHDGTTAGLTYGWYFGKDGVNFSQILPAEQYKEASYRKEKPLEKDEGYYMVKVANYCGVVYDTAFQEIWQAPTFVEQPKNEAVCLDGSIELSTKVQGGGTYGYMLWQVEVDGKGAYKGKKRLLYADTKPAFTIAPAGKVDDGYFVWIVSNQCDSVRSNPFRLTVEDEIIPIFQGVDTTVCASTGLSLVLLADKNVANNPPSASMKYYWTKNGERLSGATSTRYAISRLTASDAGVYICYAYHSCREKPLKQYNVKTKAVPVITHLSTLDPAYCEGTRDLSMRVDYTSDAGEVKSQWVYNSSVRLSDNARLSGTRTPIFTIDSVVAADGGAYAVELTNQCGSATSKQLNLKVNMPANFTVSGKLKDTMRMCVGESTVLRVTATGLEPIIYTWKKGEKVLQSGTSPSLSLANLVNTASGDYFCSAQNSCNQGQGVTTRTYLDVLTPLVYDLHIDGVKKSVGHYCGNDGVEVSLSGFERRGVYTLYRRGTATETSYVPVKVVNGDTVKTPELTFGNMGYGFYHVEAVTVAGVKSCGVDMKNEISVIRDATPEQFDFKVSNPMCTGETYGILTLSGSENNPDIEYRTEVFYGLDDDGSELWAGYGSAFTGNGQGNEWMARAGVYRVMAVNVLSGCEVQIGGNDTIAVRPYPNTFRLSAQGGDTTACFGLPSDVVLSLDGSEGTCSYMLYRNGASTGRTAAGVKVSWDTVSGGVYRVVAKTNYGCEKMMADSVVVTDLEPLKQFLFSSTSAMVFCEEEEGQPHVIALEGSTPGVRYDFYSAASGSPLSTQWGSGGHLIWNVNLRGDSTYYVVAVDTVDNCHREMASRVDVRANHLQIATESPIKVAASTQAKLKVDIKNSMGDPSVVWEPANRIVGMDDKTYTATTEILETGDRFKVTVSDSFCMKEAFVDLTVTGEVLKAQIKASDCYTSLDTLFVCEGDQVALCSYLTGGSGTYRFKWSDDQTDSIPVVQKSKLTYNKSGNGFVVLYVESDVLQEGVLITKKATDTVRVIFNSRPRVLASDNGELTCVLPRENASITLKSLEKGVVYQLEHQGVPGSGYQVLAGSLHTGAGNDTTYLIPFTEDAAGLYRVKATKWYDGEACSQTFRVTELRRAPQHFAINSQGNTTYCADTRMDSIYASGSETGVKYQLLRNKTTLVAQQTGTGDRLLFTGPYSSDVYGKSTYQVVAVIDRCADTLENSIDITSYKRPVISSITGMEPLCMGQNVAVRIPVPVQGVVYTLYKSGVADPIAQEAAATDPIEFGGAQLAGLTQGSYFVVARTQDVMACTDTARGLALMDAPGALVVLNAKPGYCDHLRGYEDGMLLTGADPLIRYELFDAPASVAGKKSFGNFATWKDDTIRYDGMLSVPAGQSFCDYYVYAHAGGCSKDVGQFRLQKYSAPLDCQLRWDLIGCVGYDLKMGVQSTEVGVDYTLYREMSGVTDSLATESGTGGHVSLGTYKEEGVYYVVATNKGGCQRRLTQEYKVRPLPDFYSIYTPNKSTYCEGERGVQIGISGTQKGVTYNLQYLVTVNGEETWQNVPSGSELLGVGGGSQLFSGYYQEGKYRVVSNYCGLPMSGTLSVASLALPKTVAVGLEGRACVDSSMNVRVAMPEEGTSYALYYEKQPTDLGSLSGANVVWNVAKARNGAYTVVADRAGCQVTLAPEIRPGEAASFGNLQGLVTGLCAEETAELFLAEGDWSNRASYALRAEGADTAAYPGSVEGGQIRFKDVPAGHNYYVVASHLSCEVEKGVYKFEGIAIPVIGDGDFAVEDCKPDGEASVTLRNLSADYQYILKGLTKSDTIKDRTGDLVIDKLENGSYVYLIYDTKTECYSLPLDTVIRRAVPADTIVSQLAYCDGGEGVSIQLSGQTFGVDYALRQTTGDPIEKMTASTIFKTVLSEGRYVYYRERTGLWGGCWLSDTFEVKKYPIPAANLVLEVPKMLCETGVNSSIVIQNSERDVAYVLQDAVTRVNVDTVHGNGSSVAFSDKRKEGTYRIVMRYKGLCESAYYKNLTVNPVPPKATVSDCRFCSDASSKCELDIRDLRTSAEYVLYNSGGKALDTIYGLNAGYFDKQPAGNYFVIGTYPATGCSDKVGDMSIKEVSRPKVFPIKNMAGNGRCEDVADVRLVAGCEGDSVKYYLYMNDYFKLAGPVTAVNGEVKFGTYREVGSYRIYAEKGDGICGAWMDGTVIIYAAPSNARLSVSGIDCSGGIGGDVVVSATKTVRDWIYYLSGVDGVSEQLVGTDGTILSWNQVADKAIGAGKYMLYAKNACDTVILMDSIVVKTAQKPVIQHLKRTQEGVFCIGDEFHCELTGSQVGVKYTLEFGDSKWDVDGDGSALSLRSVQNSGLYSVSATVDSTGCFYFMDTLTLKKDPRPENPGLSGSGNVCASGKDTLMEIALIKIRLPKTNYYLEVNGHYVDTILATAPLGQKAFKPQSEAGCYTVVVSSPSGYCNVRVDGYCLSRPPDVSTAIVGGTRSVALCEGDVLPVELEKTEVGVSYVLLDQDGNFGSQPVQGNGSRMAIGKISKAGVYSVTAFVTTECSVKLSDQLTVTVQKRPLLNVQKYHSYAQGGPGVQLKVLPETSEKVIYVLSNAEGTIDWKAASGGQEVVYDGYYTAGKYMISTLEDSGEPPFACVASDTIVVEEIKLTPFRLEVIGTPYKCEPLECRSLKLSGSEKGTSYSLFRRAGGKENFLALAEGTGKAIDFGSQCDTGYFYVMAEKRVGEDQIARTKMGADLRIYVSTIIEKYQLTGDTVGYCGSDPKGRVILNSSQSNLISYQLYCNGRPMPGRALAGKGGSKLAWDKLEGLECVENNDAGNVYTVVASDGSCEVPMAGKVNVVRSNPVSIRDQDRSFDACTGDKNVGIAVFAYGCMLSYEWTHDGTVVGNGAGYVIDSMRMEDLGSYVCKVSNYCGSTLSEPIKINVREVVHMKERMEDKLVCGTEAQDVQLVSKAWGGNYAWFRVGETDTLSRTSILELKRATAEKDAGEYWCYTWNECGGVADTVKLEFNRVPQVTGFVYAVDTLCKGTPFSLSVESRDSLVWYMNDTEITGKHDKRLNFGAVELGNEATYRVKAVNSCAEKDFNLVKLLVDDTIRILSAPEQNKHYCENSQVTLQLKTAPSNRVSYEWYKWLSLKGTGDTYVMPRVSYLVEDGARYSVRYRNKCTSGEVAQNVYVDIPIVLEKLTSPDIVCAANSLKQIIVKDSKQKLREYDQYKWYRRGAATPELMASSDTLRVARKLANRGVYYAEVTNTCGKVVSNDVELRVDSLPIIKKQPVQTVVCENTRAVFTVEATGGDLSYNWYLKRKDGQVEQTTFLKSDYSSSSQWSFEALTLAYDGAKVWCVVQNDCNYALSDTVLLTVTRNIRLTTDKKVASLCANASDVVKIPVVPSPQATDYWSYYMEKDGVLVSNPKPIYGAYTDTLVVTAPGTYRFYGFQAKGTACISDTSNFTVVVSNREIAEVRLSASGRTVVCRNDEVKMRLQIDKGKAPWKVDVRRKGEDVSAPELGGEPIIVHSRDTLLSMRLIANQTFYIASATQYLDSTACACNVSGEVAFQVQQPYETRFQKISPARFGSCQPVDLVAAFKPMPDPSIGKFYVDGRYCPDNKLTGQPGDYKVVYKSETTAGCADSTEVLTVRLDSLPTAKMSVEKDVLCTNEVTNVYCEFDGVGSFNYQIAVFTYDTAGGLVGGRPTVLRGNGEYAAYPVSYNENTSPKDSKRIYRLMSLTDAYGCAALPGTADSAKVMLHKSPTFYVAGMHPSYNNGQATESVTRFEVPASNNQIWFIATKTSGTKPWSCQIDYVTPDGEKRPPFEAKQLMADYVTRSVTEAGTYTFTVSDAYCKSRNVAVREVVHLDSGYIRVNVALEGAYNASKHTMESRVFEDNKVPKKDWGAWPAVALDQKKGIDWVTVELRKNDVNGEKVFSGEYLLLNDGSIVDRKGRTSLAVPNVDFDKKYYVVVKHRNHLPVGSKYAHRLSSRIGSDTLVDLTQFTQIYKQAGDITDHMVYVDGLGGVDGKTIFAMPAGNVFVNSLITVENMNPGILDEGRSSGYHVLDVNLDGRITLPLLLTVPDVKKGDDLSKIFYNRDKYSEIKE